MRDEIRMFLKKTIIRYRFNLTRHELHIMIYGMGVGQKLGWWENFMAFLLCVKLGQEYIYFKNPKMHIGVA